ncbi:sigma-70 family RNA polymerase sigma factor [Oceanobacillus damuensis]|uniref:sigma-70 family RNA polymerase sigma factor n=1 Tax=Oceanobacillus damuensis TaxID=937928 RepID=UPI00083286D6|nr:sigma-70 family RNA polymerase sigma factor [Oceanobacillus damuensis]
MKLTIYHKVSFEEIFNQNENRIYYHMQHLGIHDPHREFYMEGLYGMWLAYKKHQPDKGPLSTYFNFYIRNHLIDTLRKKTRQQQNDKNLTSEKLKMDHDGNRYGDTKLPIADSAGISVNNQIIWEDVFSDMTEKQQKWLYYHIILDISLKEIAERESTSVEAVKSWGKGVKKKLKRSKEHVLS